MEANDIIAAIINSFPENPIPDTTLHQAQLADQSLSRKISEKEWKEEKKKDEGITWRNVTDESLLECPASLSHLDEVGFIYYIPAYMVFAIKHIKVTWEDKEWEIVGSVIFALTNRTNYNLGRLKSFNEEQINTVIQFLHYVSEHSEDNSEDAKKALTRYWETPHAREKCIVKTP